MDWFADATFYQSAVTIEHIKTILGPENIASAALNKEPPLPPSTTSLPTGQASKQAGIPTISPVSYGVRLNSLDRVAISSILSRVKTTIDSLTQPRTSSLM